MTIKEAGTILTTLRRMNQGWFSDDISKAMDVAIDVLDRQSQIIHCKDCKHWQCGERICEDDENGFCHMAESR